MPSGYIFLTGLVFLLVNELVPYRDAYLVAHDIGPFQQQVEQQLFMYSLTMKRMENMKCADLSPFTAQFHSTCRLHVLHALHGELLRLALFAGLPRTVNANQCFV
jgi:hypothetical protein